MTRVVVGTYAEKGGPGLVPIVREGGSWRMDDPLPHVHNASWAVSSARTGMRYAVDEMTNAIAAHHGSCWETVAAVTAGGEAPCHLALSADERRLAVANYASGSVTSIALDESGAFGTADVWKGSGDGPDRERQEGPHAHWIGFDSDGTLIRVDLGTDRIVGGVGDAERTLYAAPPGSGPRHLVFHPERPLAYLISELASTLTVLRTDTDVWRAAAIVSTLPEDADAGSLGGEIALDMARRRLFVTNRGHDSIATFAIGPGDMPRLLAHTPSGGASPRFVLPAGDQLLVAHEEEGGVTIFALGGDGVPIGAPQRLAIPGAAFLMIDGD